MRGSQADGQSANGAGRKRAHRFTKRSLRAAAVSLFGVLLGVGVWALDAAPALAQATTNLGTAAPALGTNSPMQIIGLVINIFLGFLAFIAVGMIIYGGYLYLTSAGNEEKITQAKKLLRNAAIGLLIILASWGITLWLIGAITDATGGRLGGDNSPCDGCSIPAGSSAFSVVSTNPMANATNVMLCTDVTVRMSENVDKSTITNETFQLRVSGGANGGAFCQTNNACASGVCGENQACVGDTLAGSIGFGPGDQTAYFNFIPSQTFEKDTVYVATVKGGRDGVLSGDPSPEDTVDDRVAMSQSYEWSFTTGQDTDTTPPKVTLSSSSPYPADGAVDICRNTVINFNFNEAMRITTFNDTQSFLLDTATDGKPDWTDPLKLRGWSFGSLLKYAQARPAAELEAFKDYGTRLYAGDPTNNFAGAIADSCGNALDGDGDGLSEGHTIDNVQGFTSEQTENPIVWTTGENTACTPVIDSVSPQADFYGTFTGALDGESCTENADCASNQCSEAGVCVGNEGNTPLTITGRYLGPNAEVIFKDPVRPVLAAEGVNSCFDPNFVGNAQVDLSKGDFCIDEPVQTITELKLRTPVGSAGSQPQVRVAGDISEPADSAVSVLSPKIHGIDPPTGAPGQYVTFRGMNFGEQVGKVILKTPDGSRVSELRLPNAAICGNTWSVNQIIAVAPETYTSADGTEGRWQEGEKALLQVITAEGKHSDLWQFTFTNEVRPNICRVVPQCADAGGASFTLHGERLGGAQGDRRAVFTSLADVSKGYDGSITGWNDTQIEGSTSAQMGQDQYWVNVYDPGTKLNSNGLSYNIPCEPAPAVVENAQCSEGADIYPTPNPRPNEQSACVNSQIGIIFNQEMDKNSFTLGNVVVEQMNAGGGLNTNFTPIRMDDSTNAAFRGYIATKDWHPNIGQQRYHGLKIGIIGSPVDADQNGQSEGLTQGGLQPNTWYRVTITTEVKNPKGVALAKPYVYQFKTKNDATHCELTNIDITAPRSIINSYTGQPEAGHLSYNPYDGTAYAQCQLISDSNLTWNWNSSNLLVAYMSRENINKPYTRKAVVAGGKAENEGQSDVSASVGKASDQEKLTVDYGFCNSDADCMQCGAGTSTCDLATSHCTPVITSFDPVDGKPGTYANINGCYFGGTRGAVFMNKDGVKAEVEWPDSAICANTWQDNEVIVQIPAQYDSDADGTRDRDVEQGAYTFTLQTAYKGETTTSNTFTVNDTTRPGICRVQPDRGPQFMDVSAFGNSLGETEGLATFRSSDDYNENGKKDRIAALADDTTWQNTQLQTKVPVGATSSDGIEGFRAALPGVTANECEAGSTDPRCSNFKSFIASCQSNADCGSGVCREDNTCGDPDPTCTNNSDCRVACPAAGLDAVCLFDGDGPGQCAPVVTSLSPNIAGYGAAVDVVGCFFGSYGAGSAVKFNDTAAQYYCADPWSDTRITVRVPNQDQIPERSSVTVTRNDGVTSPKGASFTASQQCVSNQVPVLCSYSPTKGTAAAQDLKDGTEIRYRGEQFTAQTRTRYPNSLFGDKQGFAARGVVHFSSIPYGTTSGDVHALNGEQCVSNGKPVQVSCKTVNDCPVGNACVDGSCTPPGQFCAGKCTTGNAANVCGAASGCSLALGENGTGCCAQKPTVVSSSVENDARDICPNVSISVVFSADVIGYDSAKLQLKGGDGFTDVEGTKQYNVETHTLAFFPKTNLNTSSEYRVHLPSNEQNGTGIRSAQSLLTLQDGEKNIHFTTGDTICVPDAVDLIDTSKKTSLSNVLFSKQDQTKNVSARVTSRGQVIVPTPNVDWEYTWQPYFDDTRCDNIAWIDGEQSLSATASSQKIKSGNQNDGQTDLKVTLAAKKGWSGTSIQDTVQMRTFFCPEEQIWEYIDDPNYAGGLPLQRPYVSSRGGDTNPQYFQMIYCDTEKLATLNAPIINKGKSGDAWFLEYIFVNPSNEKNALAIRVFQNQERLGVRDWYDEHVPNPGNPQGTKVDGYEAVKDGTSYYVGASVVISGKVHNNIYLISFNQGGGEQFIADVLKYFSFNTNVSVAPNFAAKNNCSSSDKERLIRDTKRINDLGSIAASLNEYRSKNGKYPEPKSQSFASYIDNLTTSVWNSWQGALGNVLGRSLPTDPYNFFYSNPNAGLNNPYSHASDPYNAPKDAPWISVNKAQSCVYEPTNKKYYDESGTCWDPINRKFYCPGASQVYLYRKVSDTQVRLYANLEYYREYITGDSYVDWSPGSAITDACSGISNAECKCFDYGIQNGGGATDPWSHVKK